MPINVLVFSGSLRIGSYSRKTAYAVQKELLIQKAVATYVSFSDFSLPIFDYNIEVSQGIPENALKLAHLLDEHDAFVICTPEYNGSLPPILKNVLDWISRVHKDQERLLLPFENKIAAVCSSSPGHFGGIRAGDHLCAVLASLGTSVILPRLIVPQASDAFDAEGNFKNERLKNTLSRVCATLIENAVLRSTKAMS